MATVVLFGESERGEFRTAYFCQTLEQLDEYLGNSPPDTHGVHYAVQALLYKRDLLFFRVVEEGFSIADYLDGIQLLEQQQVIPRLDAICLPGVSDPAILNAIDPLCRYHHSILISSECDFYDYLTFR